MQFHVQDIVGSVIPDHRCYIELFSDNGPEPSNGIHTGAIGANTNVGGSIVLRDMRTWHRGMPNTTDQPRTMLTIVYYRQYFLPASLSLDLPEIELSQFSDQAKQIYRHGVSKA